MQRLLANRGITHPSDLDYGLNNLPLPESLLGIDKAAEVLAQAIICRQKILIVGDFDADGATSTSLAVLALTAMGAVDVGYLVPNRFDYGYGLTPEIVEVAAQRSPDVIVTVDNGISSIDGVNRAQEHNIKVVVTDHHLPGDRLPSADAIVNPNQPGCTFPSKNLAGVGVIFYVLSKVRSVLDTLNWFADQHIVKPNLANYLDLVALGTVADVVSLDSLNRRLVHQGLLRIRAGQARPGIQALIEIAGRNGRNLTSGDIGFSIAPRINAAGRLDDMSLGIRCLMSDDYTEATELARELNDLNQDRRSIEAAMQQEALASLGNLDQLQNTELPWGMCLYQADWHQGVVGILASRIKDRFHRPVIAFAQSDQTGELKGSARSIKGLHIRDALDSIATKHPGLIEKFGGHAMAAGLTLKHEHYAQFALMFDEQVRQLIDADALEAAIISDGLLEVEYFNLATARSIAELGPWGQNFPEPLFDGEFNILTQRIVGEKHLKLTVAPTASPQDVFDAIAFNVDTRVWPDKNIRQAHCAYHLDVNEFRSRESLQLRMVCLNPKN